jgi:hypothetical protein
MKTSAIRTVDPTADPVRRGAPPGSLRFYAVLFAPHERRTVLNALYALEAELHRATASNHDLAHASAVVARGADRFASGLARHPIVALSTIRERVTARVRR